MESEKKIKRRKYYASIDKMCSHCGGYADIIIPYEIKLCNKCYNKLNKGGNDGNVS